MLPHEGSGVGTPNPNHDRPASINTASATPKVSVTSTGANGTLVLRVNDNTTTGDLNSSITMDGTNLAAGKIAIFGPAAGGNVAVYNTTVAQQLEWVIGTNACTAGAITLYIATINMKKLLNLG